MLDTSIAIPGCYFPTKIAIIDDDDAFLQTLSFYLPGDHQLFNRSNAALEALLGYRPQISDAFWLKSNVEADIRDGMCDGVHEKSLIIDTSKMTEVLNNKEKYQDISVVIIDFKMPEVDGITILEALKNKPFKKILLTANGGSKLGVKAFNDGLIDYFIPKDEENLLGKLKNIVQKLKAEYFFNITQRLQECSTHVAEINANAALKNYFNELLIKRSICEFYLVDLAGAYILLDEQHKKHYFVMHTADQLQELAEIAEQDGASTDTIHQIKSGHRIPFFGQNKNYWEVPGREWGNYLYPSKAMESLRSNLFVSAFEAN